MRSSLLSFNGMLLLFATAIAAICFYFKTAYDGNQGILKAFLCDLVVIDAVEALRGEISQSNGSLYVDHKIVSTDKSLISFVSTLFHLITDTSK